jgi:tetratricopeptide (TPR) repeat protein
MQHAKTLSCAFDPLPGQFQEAFTCFERGQSDRAQMICEDILKVQPRHAECLHLLGVIAAHANDTRRAVVLISKSIKIEPANAIAYLNRGSALQLLDRCEAALDDYHRAIALQPALAAAHFNCGGILKELERFDEALTSYDRGIAIEPRHPDVWLNRGNVLTALRRWDDALASYDRAILLRPDSAVAHCNRGNVLLELNRLQESLDSHDRAISIEPKYAAAHTNRAVTLLLSGELERGWRDFEWRWKIQGPSQKGRGLRQPLWVGEQSLAGKTILLYAEQGLGDTLQFCRYVPMVAALGARVILEVQRPLSGLLAGLNGVSRLVVKGEALPEAAYQCPLLSLPLAFKTRLGTIPSFPRYLESSKAKVADWQARLGIKSRPRIGLFWTGGRLRTDDHRRVPFDQLMAHLPAGFQYVSLQKELPAVDRPLLRAHSAIMDVAVDLKDFSDTAALCDCLDLVISVDSGVAHLSGALGKRTWILLPSSPDWRWLLNRSDSPWYPSATLYRQESPGDWRGVLARMRTDLQAM